MIGRRRRPCSFCAAKTEPSLADVGSLEQLLTDRGKIIARKRTGLCAQHQRRLTHVVKQARFVALLPFIQRTV